MKILTYISSKVLVKKDISYLLCGAFLAMLSPLSNAAVSTFFGDTFFPNPADMKMVNDMELTTGAIGVSPRLKFTGTQLDSTGTGLGGIPGPVIPVNGSDRTKNFVDVMPYWKIYKRINDKVVLGVDFAPVNYGHVLWEVDSFVAPASTETHFYGNAVRPKVSYQVNDSLAIGGAIELNRQKALLSSRSVAGSGDNMRNEINTWQKGFKIGANYMLNQSTFLTAVYRYGYKNTRGGNSVSDSGNKINRSYRNIIVDTNVAMIGVGKFFSPKLFGIAKVYWSEWSNFKKLQFNNVAIAPGGESPTKFKNVLSFEVATRYQYCDNHAGFVSVMYETKPTPELTNNLAYPTAPYITFFLGLDSTLNKNISSMVYYGYGKFMPKGKITRNTQAGGNFPWDFNGKVSLDVHMAGIQFSYKI